MKDKVLLFGNLEAIKLYSMRENDKYKNKWNNLSEEEKFKLWLVGFTDGDGCFSIVKSGGTYRLQFSLSQSEYNLRLLYYVKKNLGYGSVSKSSKQSWGNFRITDRKVLNQVIFPIFEKYPLLTSKYYNYERFKQAYYILENKELTTEMKNKKIEELRSKELPVNYISPAVIHLNEESKYEDIVPVISVYWLAGFIEAEGHFGVYTYPKRIAIDFTIVQKLDQFLLFLIKRVLHIPSNVNYNKSRNIYVLSTSNSRVINGIIDTLRGKLYGMKSLEFKLWSVAHYYRKTKIEKVYKVNKILTKLGRRNNNK
uniref:LAGLIDADG endonuclease n=3 Tax=Fusarium fujikuroi species complex TaxID=171627 RepID=A0A6M4AZC5_9HYPO|nr:LAGLIDADG endonuclease [Fusarium brevicatenulatum]QJQ35355.1 LAGLIDADG endonuclease [Fusarium pseudoanthophilum]QJQ35387.1 LAGLIDADG endonuclease [Fusarium pseudonygamai]